jgi:hypothetical protein
MGLQEYLAGFRDLYYKLGLQVWGDFPQVRGMSDQGVGFVVQGVGFRD